MPFVAQDLIEGKSKPVTVFLDDRAQRALELMVENNFSQIPVVDSANKPLGLVTSDSILRGVAFLKIPLEKLRIEQVKEDVDRFYTADYPIFDLLSGLNVYPAVLIIDSEGKLTGIITNWDTADYFRDRASNMMMLEDVEELLKAHVRSAFTHKQPKDPEKLLQTAINEVTNTSEQLFKNLKGALHKYINLANLQHSPNEEHIREAFSSLIRNASAQKTLDDLTFYEYIQLILYKPTWESYGAYLAIPAESLRGLLEDIKDSRNALAHFRREITPIERQRIEYCISLLQQTYPPLHVGSYISTISAGDNDVSVEEEELSLESMYAPLVDYLMKQPRDIERVHLTFEEVEKVLHTRLPDSAWAHRSWWLSTTVSRIQHQLWSVSGWRVQDVSMSDRKVTFARSREREAAYFSFFIELQKDLKAKADFKLIDLPVGGGNWITVKALPVQGRVRKMAWLNYSFSRNKQLRAELYIDSDDKDTNERIFDSLFDQKEYVEQDFGDELQWDRLDNRRVCRVAAYHDGAITDDEQTLENLRAWAVDAMIRLDRAISDKVESIIKDLFEH